jgi:hypothetical protein
MRATYTGETNEHYTNGDTYYLTTRSMTGKRYKDLNDRVGEPDTRIMVWKDSGNPALKVYENDAAILEVFQLTKY